MATYRCDDTRDSVMQFWPPDDENIFSKHVEAWNKLIVKQKFCASIWLITEINIFYRVCICYLFLSVIFMLHDIWFKIPYYYYYYYYHHRRRRRRHHHHHHKACVLFACTAYNAVVTQRGGGVIDSPVVPGSIFFLPDTICPFCDLCVFSNLCCDNFIHCTNHSLARDLVAGMTR